VLRYEDRWDDLQAGLAADRAAGLAPSAVRDALADWFDPGSFVEVGSLVRRAASSYRGGDTVDVTAAVDVPSDGLIAGWGRLDGALVFVVADDPALGSAVRGPAAAAKAARIRAHALEQSRPLVQILAAGRAEDERGPFVRIGHGVDLDLERDAAARLLTVAVVTGPVVEQAAAEAASAHLVVLAGPDAAVAGRAGTAAVHLGLADAVATDLATALAWAGAALRRLPPNRFDPPPGPADPAGLQPASGAGADGFLDADWSVELGPGRHDGLRVVLGRVGGTPIGLLAVEAGAVLDGPSARTARRLLRACDALSMPVVVAHHGLAVAAVPTVADTDAVIDLCDALAARQSPLLELAGAVPGLAEALGVLPLWSASAVADRKGRDLVLDVLGLLRVRRARPDQDPRVRQRPRRGLLPQ
jgi:acetyl-CoA carboxylase carboxyltransferase component